MNGIINPRFNNEHILRTTMLNAVNDMAHDFPMLLYEGYCNGVISGCRVTSEKDELTVGRGLILYNDEICYIREPMSVKYKPTDTYHTLRLRIKEAIVKEGCSYRLVELINAEGLELMDNEIEMCRFKLKAGSRLRSKYRDFEDYNTEYDTVNILHVKMATKGEATIHPDILNAFAKEAIDFQMDQVDAVFVIRAMGGNLPIAREAILAYLSMRSGVEYKNYTNDEIFEMLDRVLGLIKDNGRRNVLETTVVAHKGRGIILE